MKRLKILLIVVVVLLIVLAGGGVWFVRRPWPQVDGTINITGLSAAVRVVRDRWGVPQIYAQNERDLFIAQGYVHAQDRLWQMEFNRRVASGTLSAVVGQRPLNTDRFMRTLGMRRVAERQWAEMDDESRAILEAYAQGVTTYIETHRRSLPLQFTALGVDPAPWTPIDSLAYGNVISFSLGGNYRLELLRAKVIAGFGEDIAQQLIPAYEPDKPLIVPALAASYSGLRTARFDGLEAVDVILGDPGPVWGSNNWVIHGSHTATGKPLLANDTHLGLGMPSIWYENGLHGGRFNSVGFTFPGVPTVVIGHNQRIAWGQSNLNPDVEDFYIEKLNDRANPTQYEFMGQWQNLQVIQETIEVKKQQPVNLAVRLTRHGPLLNDVIGNLADAEPMALHWTVLDGSALFSSIVGINLAGNWQEFREAISHWDAPGQNFVYADIDGNIGYQSSGKIPIRSAEHQGTVPVPGWTGEYEWNQFIPFDKLPSAFNPPAGFLASANNKVVGDDYPYRLANEWDVGYRAKRITDVLSANNRVTIADIQQLHADTYSLPAEAMRPYLLSVKAENERQQQALEYVKAWDLRYETDRVGASIFQTWFWFMIRNTLNDDLGKDLADQYLAGQYERHGTFQIPLMVKLLAEPQNPWFDDKTTAQTETRDDIMRRSLADALAWLGEHYGDDPRQWTWGRLHSMTFVEAPLGQSGIGILERIFNSGPVPARGDNFTVDAASYSFSQPFVMIHGASQRAIIDLSNFDQSLSIHTTGQSGQAFHPHRADFIQMWQNVQYHPLPFSQTAVEVNAAAVLTLAPGTK